MLDNLIAQLTNSRQTATLLYIGMIVFFVYGFLVVWSLDGIRRQLEEIRRELSRQKKPDAYPGRGVYYDANGKPGAPVHEGQNLKFREGR